MQQGVRMKRVLVTREALDVLKAHARGHQSVNEGEFDPSTSKWWIKLDTEVLNKLADLDSDVSKAILILAHNTEVFRRH